MRECFERYEEVFAQNNLRLAGRKSVQGADGGEIQGLLFKSDRVTKITWGGLAPLKRARLLTSGWALLGMRVPGVRPIQRWVGKYQHAALPQRHPLSVLESLFFSEAERTSPARAWGPTRWEELGLAAALVPLLSVNLSAEFDVVLGASDASNFGLGVSEALLESPEMAQQLAQHAAFRGDYTALDAAVPGLAHWDASAPARMKALRIETDKLRWRHVIAAPRKTRSHINIGEGTPTCSLSCVE
jgi:hypothetical protein